MSYLCEMSRPEYYLRSYPEPDGVQAHAAAVEEDGWNGLLFTDTQNLSMDVFGSLYLAASATSQLKLGTAVTNLLTRHPAVVSSAFATLHQDDPLSMTGWTSSTSILERPSEGWRIRTETTTEVWSERNESGEYVFRYQATVQTFIGDDQGKDQPFEEKTVEGSVPRLWV